MIRVQPQAPRPGEDQNVVDQAAASAVKAKLGPGYTFRNTDVVGPKVSQELLHDGVDRHPAGDRDDRDLCRGAL